VNFSPNAENCMMTPCKYDWRGLYQLDMSRGRLKMNVADFSHNRSDMGDV